MADVTDVTPGTAVTVLDAGGRFVGRGVFNPRPALCCRILTWTDEPIDGLLRPPLDAALAARAPPRRARVRAARLERGRLPARAGRRSLRARGRAPVPDARHGAPAAAGRSWRRCGAGSATWPVMTRTTPRWPAWRASRRRRAGSIGRAPTTSSSTRTSCAWRSAPGSGHKTGLYLDQAENRGGSRTACGPGATCSTPSRTRRASPATRSRAGARRAVCLESSPDAVAGARAELRAERRGRARRDAAVNAFDELRRLERAGERFGLVVLDPPPFARSPDGPGGGAARLQGDQPARHAPAGAGRRTS